MGLFDRFRSKKGKSDKRKHVVDQKKQADDAKKKLFRSVPSAGREETHDVRKKDGEQREKNDQPGSGGKQQKKRETGPAYRVLVRPLITEKGNLLASNGQYLFAVNPHSNKLEVAEAVERVYGVRPRHVNVMNVRGKHVRYGRTTGSTKSWKKAIVTLPKGKTIDVFEG